MEYLNSRIVLEHQPPLSCWSRQSWITSSFLLKHYMSKWQIFQQLLSGAMVSHAPNEKGQGFDSLSLHLFLSQFLEYKKYHCQMKHNQRTSAVVWLLAKNGRSLCSNLSRDIFFLCNSDCSTNENNAMYIMNECIAHYFKFKYPCPHVRLMVYTSTDHTSCESVGLVAVMLRVLV